MVDDINSTIKRLSADIENTLYNLEKENIDEMIEIDVVAHIGMAKTYLKFMSDARYLVGNKTTNIYFDEFWKHLNRAKEVIRQNGKQ